MPHLPTGTVTFLLTDIEGSTRRWEESPGAMRQAMARHDEVITESIARERGHIVESGREGDSVLAVFESAADALTCAIQMQRRFYAEPWPAGAQLRVRIALNSGEAEFRGGHYYGQAVYRCARLMAIAHGGQVLVSQATSELVEDNLPAGCRLLDLGHHRLKDLDRPERVSQVLHPELQAEFPRLRSLDEYRHNLPAQTSSFVDRPAELAAIAQALATHRLVTLTGAAGSGKTRLALQTALQVIDSYADGVWLVELASLSDQQLLLPTLMQGVGAKEESGRSLEETLTDYLRSKQLLIILDNCEHVVSGAAHAAGFVLSHCPLVRVLATSRQPLGVAGEANWPVPPMAVDTEAAALFNERARAARASFAAGEHQAEVLEICRRLDGIPLAIELAAARVSVISPAEILRRLVDRFRLLTAAPRTAAVRHRTLRAALDWSYELLDPIEQELFIRLSVFAGGFSLESAEAVCGDATLSQVTILDLLGQLVERSLVSVEDSAGARTRYRLLETVREYGREKLARTGHMEAVSHRHAGHFLELAEAAEPKLSGPGGLEWLERLDADQDNLRAVFDNTAVDDADLQLRLAAALRGYWDARGLYAEARARLSSALAKAAAPTPVRARALRSAAFIAWAQGDHAAARAWCEEGLDLCLQLGDQLAAGMCLQQLGQIAFQQEDYGSARIFLDQALAVAAQQGDERLAALCRFRLGLVAQFKDEPAEARQLLETALAAGRQIGDEQLVAVTLHALGHLALTQGHLDEAQARLSESLLAWRERGGPRQIAGLLEVFAGVAAANRQAERALRLGAAAENLRKEVASLPPSAHQRDIMERLRAARAGLGDVVPEPLSREEAIAYALDQG